MISETVLTVENLQTQLHTENGTVRAVNSVSLKVHANETVALVGESGGGKSMTALSIMRLEPSSARIVSGKVIFDGQDLLTMSPEEIRGLRGSRMAMIYQDPMTFLNPIMRIDKQVAEVLMTHERVGKTEARQRVLDVFTLLGMPSPERVVTSYPHQLSGGMRQRIIIAMAIICNPLLLVADEPTTALDVSIQAQIMELLRETQRKMKNSLLLITHDLGVVAENCDRVYVMYAGMIVEQGDIMTIFHGARHPYTMGLINSNLSPDRPVDRFETIEGEVPNLIHLPHGCAFHPRCNRRIQICDKQMPSMIPLGDDHAARCWLLAKRVPDV